MTQQHVAVFGASAARPGDGHFEDGVRCGRLLAEAGFGVVTGGYGGLMEAVSAGAHQAGAASVVGITAPTVFRERVGGNGYLTEERPAATLTERLHQLIDTTAACITLHGSLGTLTELIASWNLAFVARYAEVDPKPVIVVGERWGRLVRHLGAELSTDASVVSCVETVDEGVALLVEMVGPGR